MWSRNASFKMAISAPLTFRFCRVRWNDLTNSTGSLPYASGSLSCCFLDSGWGELGLFGRHSLSSFLILSCGVSSWLLGYGVVHQRLVNDNLSSVVKCLSKSTYLPQADLSKLTLAIYNIFMISYDSPIRNLNGIESYLPPVWKSIYRRWYMAPSMFLPQFVVQLVDKQCKPFLFQILLVFCNRYNIL